MLFINLFSNLLEFKLDLFSRLRYYFILPSSNNCFNFFGSLNNFNIFHYDVAITSLDDYL